MEGKCCRERKYEYRWNEYRREVNGINRKVMEIDGRKYEDWEKAIKAEGKENR